jgi:predicted RNA-binding Zn-ribbon protein involved in translation (DUF1610 family)
MIICPKCGNEAVVSEIEERPNSNEFDMEETVAMSVTIVKHTCELCGYQFEEKR